MSPALIPLVLPACVLAAGVLACLAILAWESALDWLAAFDREASDDYRHRDTR